MNGLINIKIKKNKYRNKEIDRKKNITKTKKVEISVKTNEQNVKLKKFIKTKLIGRAKIQGWRGQATQIRNEKKISRIKWGESFKVKGTGPITIQGRREQATQIRNEKKIDRIKWGESF